jgi:phosphatidylserine/phosphatidylglycerophosphate/cardiolipin synthase-like enzyme
LTADHFVYFCDWQLILDTWMDLPDGSRKTFKDIIEAASRDHGVQIRALLYQGQSLNDPVHNAPMADWINRLPTGGAILDRRYLNFGSHHQKMVVCLSSDGLVGYCGGMDIAEDRQWRDGGPRPPKTGEPAAWHDVQLRLRGPAAYQLWRTFNARWIDHPLSRIDLGIVNQRSVETPPLADNTPRGRGHLQVQVVRTFGNGSRHDGLDIGIYPGLKPMSLFELAQFQEHDPLYRSYRVYGFAPDGEMSIYNLLCKAIRNTARTIYLEDQYLIESERIGTRRGNVPSIAEVLASTIARSSFEKMIVLTPIAGTLQPELYQVWRRRVRFWQQLGAGAKDKVVIYAYNGDPAGPYLVHSKTWIFDDRFAVVGSANCNRRGYSHDSEIAAGVGDENPAGNRLSFAHELRIRLWLKHLNMKDRTTASRNDLIDFKSGSKLWDSPKTILTRIDLDHPNYNNPDTHITREKLKEAFQNLPPHVKQELPLWAPELLDFTFDWDKEWDLIDPSGG